MKENGKICDLSRENDTNDTKMNLEFLDLIFVSLFNTIME